MTMYIMPGQVVWQGVRVISPKQTNSANEGASGVVARLISQQSRGSAMGLSPRRMRRSGRMVRRIRWGGAILEFALILPILISLPLGMLEIGRGFMAANALTTAAREGARSGIVPNGDNAKVQAAVDGALANQGISTSHLATTIKVNGAVGDVATATSGSTITVSVSVPYNDVSWVGVGHYLGGTTLTAYAAMRRE